MVLHRLVEQSVVARKESRGRSRYRLLEPIRQFCITKIESDELSTIRLRHAQFYAERASVLGEGINGNNELHAAADLNAEWPDLREAVTWGRKNRIVEIAADPIVAIARTVMFHLRTEAYRWLTAAEQEFGEALAGRSDVLWVIANGHWVIGSPDLAEQYLRRSEAIEVTSQSLWVKFFLRFSQKRFEESAAAAEHAKQLARQSGDEIELRWWTNALQAMPLLMADPQDSRIDEIMAGAEAQAAKLDWPTGEAFLHLAKGNVAMMRGHLEEAAEYKQHAIDVALSCSNRWIELITRLVVDNRQDDSISPRQRLAKAIESLRALIDLGEEAHYPLALRQIVLAMIACEKLEEAIRCTVVVESVYGVGDKDEFTPDYPTAVDQVRQSLGEADFQRQRNTGTHDTVKDVLDLSERVLQSLDS